MDGHRATATSELGAKYGVLCTAYDALEAERDEWKRRAEVAEADRDRYSREVVRAGDVEVNLRAKLARAVEALEKVEWRIRNEHDEMAALVDIYDTLATLQDVPQPTEGEADPITDCDKLREERDRWTRMYARCNHREQQLLRVKEAAQRFVDAYDANLCWIENGDEDVSVYLDELTVTLHPDTPEQGETCQWRHDRGDRWYTECGYRILGLALRGKPCVCGKPIEITGGEDD
jgi:hypothetical protein